jgi:hypothetical protein
MPKLFFQLSFVLFRWNGKSWVLNHFSFLKTKSIMTPEIRSEPTNASNHLPTKRKKRKSRITLTTGTSFNDDRTTAFMSFRTNDGQSSGFLTSGVSLYPYHDLPYW